MGRDRAGRVSELEEFSRGSTAVLGLLVALVDDETWVMLKSGGEPACDTSAAP